MDIKNQSCRSYLKSFFADLFFNVSKKIIVPYFNNLKLSQIEKKSDEFDFVTLADKNAEEYLAKKLINNFQNIKVIGEESSFINNLNINEIDEGYYWTIDPIDGTKNYIKSNKNFCSMISLVYQKKPIAAFIYSPISNVMTFAFKNYGTYNYDLKNKFLKKLIINFKFDFLGTGGAKGIPEAYRSNIIKRLKEHTKRIFIGSAGIETIYLVNNKVNFIIHGRVTPWDHAPFNLVIKEAGGVVLMLRDKTDYSLSSSGPILASSNIENWNKIRNLILPTEDNYRIR